LEIKTIDIEAEVAKRALQYEKELEEVMCSLFRVPSEFVTNYPDRSSTFSWHAVGMAVFFRDAHFF